MSLGNDVNKLIQLFEQVTRIMHRVSGLLLMLMMFSTILDVGSRALFSVTNGSIDLTFIGGVEIIKFGLLLVVLFALPYSVGRSQVIVDLFTEQMSTRSKAWLDGFYILGFMLLGFGMSVQFYHAISYAHMTGETTQDLQLPLFYLYGIACVATGMLGLSALINAGKLFMTKAEEHS